MIVSAIAILSLMAVANYWIGRHLLYPSVVFCSVWAADLALVSIAGDFFYPLSGQTLAVLCIGALAFSVGGMLGLLVPIRPSIRHAIPGLSNRLVTILVVALACSIPFVYQWIVGLTSDIQVASLLMAARMAIVEADEAGSSSLLFENTLVLSIIVALVAFTENKGATKRSVAAITIAMLLNALTGARNGIIMLLFSIFCIDSIHNKTIRWKYLAGLAVLFVAIFGGMAILVQKGDARVDVALEENVKPVLESLVLYSSGGVVAFDRVMRQPSLVVHNWQINRFFIQTLNKLGTRFDVPSQHSEFVAVGPTNITNVYTIYFAYLDLGLIGIVFVMIIIGIVTTIVFRRAVCGDRLYLIIYSCLFSGILLSPFGEMFFMNLNFLVKLYMACWLIYSFPRRKAENVHSNLAHDRSLFTQGLQND